MPTNNNLQSAAEFLAMNLWEPEPYFDHEDSVGTIYIPNIKVRNNWQPYADTPEGWWQAKMIVEKMRERGFKLEVWASSIDNFHVRFVERPQYWEIGTTFGAAITLTAAHALDWKEE